MPTPDSPFSRLFHKLSGKSMFDKRGSRDKHHHDRKKNLIEESITNLRDSSSQGSSRGSSPISSSGNSHDDLTTIEVPSSPHVASNFAQGHDVTFDSKHYEVLKKLGKGEYGKVLLVKSNGSLFALKEQKMKKAGFGHEVDLHLKISQEGDHNNIVKLYYASSGRGKVGHIALEYCPGVCLDTLISYLTEDEIRYIMREVLKGVEFLHNVGIMHRDLKPENIMVSYDGSVKIIDLGMAINYANEVSDQAFGSPLYMAPEQIACINCARVYTEKVDIWSLGITMMELAIGRLPHTEIIKTDQLVRTVIEGDSPSLASMQREAKNGTVYTKDFHDFIDLCLTKDPRARPSAFELLKHPLLERINEESVANSLGRKVNMKRSPITNNKNKH